MIVVVDIDGTLALRNDRDPFDWDRVLSDKPNLAVITCVRALRDQGCEIVFVSGREEFLRELTLTWLDKHVGIEGRLLMRQTGDFRSDDTVKAEFIENGTIDPQKILLVLDDRDRVVRMWREQFGLVCFQVANGSF